MLEVLWLNATVILHLLPIQIVEHTKTNSFNLVSSLNIFNIQYAIRRLKYIYPNGSSGLHNNVIENLIQKTLFYNYSSIKILFIEYKVKKNFS